MRRILPLLLLFLLLAAQTALCETWERSPTHHWRTDDTGAKLDASEHSLDASGRCSVCRSDFWVSEDGTCDVFSQYENGNMFCYSSFAADGTLLFDERYDYVYDDSGAITQMTITGVSPDSGSYVSVYNEYGDPVSNRELAADGTILSDIRFVYEYDANGVKTRQLCYEGERLASESLFTLVADANGAWSYESSFTLHGEDGSRHVFQYDESGLEISSALYGADGALLDGDLSVTTEGEEEILQDDGTSTAPAEGGAYLTEG